MADEITKEDVVAESKIKLGDSEYDMDQVQGWVEKAKAIEDFETKQGQPWDEVVKSWGQRGEVIGKFKKATGAETPEELQERRAAEEKSALESRANSGQELTAEEQEKLAKETLTKYLNDLGYVDKTSFDQMYHERRSGEKLLNQVGKILKTAEKEGKPTTTVEELLTFMADPSNPKDPEKAYKLKFEKELDDWKEQKLSSLKKKEVQTEPTSQAGVSREPDIRPASTKEDLRARIREALRSEPQQ